MNREKFREMYDLLMEQLDVSRELSDDEILGVIDELILTQARELFLSLKEKVELRQELFCSVRKLDVLQELIDDESVTEIMVNGPDHIFVEHAGRLYRLNKKFDNERQLEDIIQKIVGKAGKEVNQANPIVDTRLPDGSRVNVVLPPVSLSGPIVTIRKFSKTPMTVEMLLKYGSLTREAAAFLEKLVRAKYNIFITEISPSQLTGFQPALIEKAFGKIASGKPAPLKNNVSERFIQFYSKG